MTSPVLLMTPLHAPTQRELESTREVHRHWSAPDRDALVASLADRCEVVVTSGGRGLEAAMMRALPKLKLVACFGVGVDAIDVEHARAHGIAVTNTPDVLTDDVADLAVALMLASLRQVVSADRWVREGRWVSQGAMPLATAVARRKVGIVGLGRIGAAIATRCEAFGTEVAWHGPRRKDVKWAYFDDPVALARWADVLIAACPGGPATKGIVSRAVLEALGPRGHFVNIARGSVVDQPAMVELLKSGALGGAGLDVFDDEPNVPADLIALPHVVLQPHQASATDDTRGAMGRLVLDNVAAWFDGRPLVTPV
ncbi:MAG TPA: 2-hydroxyacid dehydrogenase [Burkholderiaceae bacterium]|nr:2-hydroxyacid dehydrogenase [Burkholderiaceae bacterium]